MKIEILGLLLLSYEFIIIKFNHPIIHHSLQISFHWSLHSPSLNAISSQGRFIEELCEITRQSLSPFILFPTI
jgi:hypothetical protein